MTVEGESCQSLVMLLSAGASLVAMAALTADHASGEPETREEVVPRTGWGAREPKYRVMIPEPLDTVVIHHTYIPPACRDRMTCIQAMRSMQNFHMDDRGWADIGYNFAVGGDAVYEGRGWMVVGAHCPGYNNHSVGISFIGDYTDELPTEFMLKNALSLIESGVDRGFIRPDYQLIGHRQGRETECPGNALYQLIQTWSHWTPTPWSAPPQQTATEQPSLMDSKIQRFKDTTKSVVKETDSSIPFNGVTEGTVLSAVTAVKTNNLDTSVPST